MADRLARTAKIRVFGQCFLPYPHKMRARNPLIFKNSRQIQLGELFHPLAIEAIASISGFQNRGFQSGTSYVLIGDRWVQKLHCGLIVTTNQ
jgi:hypothetical protein